MSEHQCEGWLEGYLLTGRHGFFSCYEAFIHIVDSMFNQHAKWLKVANHIPWLGWTCGECRYCRSARENLCDRARFTGYTLDGGIVVCGGIHMSDIPSFPYEILWQERTICSVANLTGRDGEEFLALAPRVPVRTEIETFPLEEANDALARLRSSKLQGAAVLVMD